MGSSDSRGGGGWFDDELSIYRIAEDDRFVGVHEILAASDEDAMLQARQLLDGLDLEVWRGNEKIG
jgi:hypothetical protein